MRGIENKKYIDQYIAENEYNDPNNNLSRTAFASLVYQPLLESTVKNAYAHNKGIALYNAMNNGGYYSNYTFLGGNFIFGGENEILKKIPGLKNLYDNKKIINHSNYFKKDGKFGPQFISGSYNKNYYETKGFAKDFNDVFESGFGFGRKYNFNHNDKTVFNILMQRDDTFSNNMKNLKGMSSDEIKSAFLDYSEDVLKGKNTIISKKMDYDKIQKTFDLAINEKGEIDIRTIKKITEGILTEDEINSISLKKSKGKKQLKKMFNQRITQMRNNSDIDLLNFFGQSEKVKKAFSSIDDIFGDSKGITEEIAKKLTNEFGENFFDVYDNLNDIFNKNGVNGIKEVVLRGMISQGEKFDDIIDPIAKKIFNHLNLNTAKKITMFGGKISFDFSLKNIANKFFGNSMAMVITGAMSGPIAAAVQVALGVASTLSIVHQENTINNAISNRLVNYDSNDFIDSYKGDEALQSHYAINQSNYIDFQNIITNRNISKNALRSIDPIEIDQTLSDNKNFTIF